MRETNEMGSQFKERRIYCDYLRVWASFAIIIIHVSAQNWYSTDIYGFDWKVFNLYDSIVRWGVPVFVMISGSLFLDREISLKHIYQKYILRLLVSYVVWSLIYALVMGKTREQTISLIEVGYYHMWFIPMMIGLYMCIPFIKPIIESEYKTKYFLMLAFLFVYAIPMGITLAKDFGSATMIQWANIFNRYIGSIPVPSVLGYLSYFVLGYYINIISLSKKQRILIYIIGLLGFISTIELTLIVTLRTQVLCANYYNYFSINVLFEALAVFVWFKYGKFNNKVLNMIIRKVAKYSFGTYLVHILILEQLNLCFGLNTRSFNSVLSVLCIGIIVFVASYAVSALLNQIPVIKKYMI